MALCVCAFHLSLCIFASLSLLLHLRVNVGIYHVCGPSPFLFRAAGKKPCLRPARGGWPTGRYFGEGWGEIFWHLSWPKLAEFSSFGLEEDAALSKRNWQHLKTCGVYAAKLSLPLLHYCTRSTHLIQYFQSHTRAVVLVPDVLRSSPLAGLIVPGGKWPDEKLAEEKEQSCRSSAKRRE